MLLQGQRRAIITELFLSENRLFRILSLCSEKKVVYLHHKCVLRQNEV